MPVLVSFTAIRSNARFKPGPLIRAELEGFTQDWCAEIVRNIEAYPPIPGPPNRYVRTGRLFANWRIRSLGNGDEIKYVIDNPVQDKRGRYYVNYVNGPSGQTSFHSAHGWHNISEYKDRATYQIGVQSIISTMGGSAV